jgi:hypothetical protein
LYLGRPGRWLVLPDPAPGVGASLVRPFGEHTTLDGGRVIDFAGAGRRVFTLRWQRLTDDEYAVLEQVHGGAHGPGPFVLLPTGLRWNYLSAWQAASGGIGTYPAGFYLSDATEWWALASTPHPVLRGPRAIAWQLTPGTLAGRMRLHSPSGGTGWPVVPGLAWTFTIAAQADPQAGIPVRVTVLLRWFDTDGAEVTTTQVEATVTPGAWSPLLVSGTPPSAAVTVHPEVIVADASVTAETALYLDTPALEIGPARGWLPGRGVPVVSMVELSDTYAWHDLHDCEATLREVA